MKDEYNDMFFELHYLFIYFRYIEQGIRKYKKIYSNILSGCSIISAISVWIRHYIPFLNFVTVIASAFTVAMVFIVMKLSYSEQLIYLDLFNREATELINDIKTQKRNIDHKYLVDSKIQRSIEEFESRFRKLDKLYIEPLKLPTDDKLSEKSKAKASTENNVYFEKEELNKK